MTALRFTTQSFSDITCAVFLGNRDELELYYQPRINIASVRVTSVEALLRRQHPQLEMIPPAEFIPIAEENGLIIDIGYHVLEHACLQPRQWQDDGYEHISVAVNLSAVQFSQRDLHCCGMRISIDDFGTGYCSLNHLKRFPINTVKSARLLVTLIKKGLPKQPFIV